ncbi:MAG: hypothetical protein HFF53_09590 [Lawsonibacter sp.]|mgnify:CR=1 FL=1|nr:hypothetical protein [Lawsonibacter sp.]
MQDLFAELMWRNTEVDEAADRLRRTLPGFEDARRDYNTLAEQIRSAVGYELYERFSAQLSRYTSYDALSYYSLGLGLREEVVRAMGL